MHRSSFEDMHCSVARCLDIVGEWWSLLIIRDAMLGVARFDDFQARLGISRNILTQRLGRLVDNEVLTRVRYCEHPPRSEYRLTAKGRDLWLVVTAMREWGDRWTPPAGGPPLLVRHKDCGQVTSVVPTCDRCGEPMDVRSVAVAAGPGAVPEDLARTPLAPAPR